MHPLLKDRLRTIANVADPHRRLRNFARTSIGGLRYRNRAILSAGDGNRRIGEMLRTGAPASVGKIGASELRIVLHHARRIGAASPKPYPAWLRREAHAGPGVFPTDDESLDRFSESWLKAVAETDLLAVWFNHGEHRISERYCGAATLAALTSLEPYYHPDPWTRHLSGKTVLVVSPFARSIESQYTRRGAIWAGQPEVLPEFELRTLPCPLSPALVDPGYPDWFALRDALIAEMARVSFDVVLVGAGALSVPLCAAARRLGRIGIHLGGATQILFGIKGGRWDRDAVISAMYNDAWVRPSAQETPPLHARVERGAYW